MTQTLYINSSLKKAATTYIHQLFYNNHLVPYGKKADELIVPPIKEWYLIPRVRPLISGVPTNLINLPQKASKIYSSLQDENQKQFCSNVIDYPYCFQPSEIDIVNRIKFILSAFPRDAHILISDPNFLADIGLMDQCKSVDLIKFFKIFSLSFKVRFFNIYRDPSDCAASLLKMHYAKKLSQSINLNFFNAYGNLLLLYNSLLKSQCTTSIYAFDFKCVTQNPSKFFDLFSQKYQFSINQEFVDPGNPNSSKDRNVSYDSLNNEIKNLKLKIKQTDCAFDVIFHDQIKNNFCINLNHYFENSMKIV